MELFDQAKAARENAHAPYSGFQVGAAIRTDSGRVFAGCNVENAAYPEGTCAEAGAIAAMVAAGESSITEVLVIGDSPSPCTPCGGCRQKLAEFAPPDVPVRMADLNGVVMETTIGALLPHAFAAAHLPETDD